MSLLLRALLALWGATGAPHHGEEAIYLAFADEHSRGIIGGFGHVFAVFAEPGIQEAGELLTCDAVTFGSRVGPTGDGLWVGRYSVVPAHELLRKYAHLQGRRVTFFELPLSTNDVRDLRADLEDRCQQTERYGFLRRNCGFYLADWLLGRSPPQLLPLYLTPSQAVRAILDALPPTGVFVEPSALDVLRDGMRDRSSYVRRLVRRAVEAPAEATNISDLELQLLTLKVAETVARASDVTVIAEARRRILFSEQGQQAARAAIERADSVKAVLASDLRLPVEGPALAIEQVQNLKTGNSSARAILRSGVRGLDSSLENVDFFRVVRFLDIELQLDADHDASATLLEINTWHDWGAPLSTLSSGITAGYESFESSWARRGAFASAWVGPAWRAGSVWYGLRVGGVLDELDSDPNAAMLGGCAARYSDGALSTTFDLNLFDQGEFGLLVTARAHVWKGARVGARFERDPNGSSVLGGELSWSF